MSLYKACSCRDPETKRLLGNRCPDIKLQVVDKKGRTTERWNPKHGAWYGRYEAPPGPNGKRRQPRVGPFATEKECSAALDEARGLVRRGEHVDDRNLKVGDYLTTYIEGREAVEDDLAKSTVESYREAIDLYFKPGLGHLRLVDLRDHHIRDLYAAMRKINRPEADEDTSDLMRRLVDARAKRHGRRYSTRPLTPARIKRMHAVLSKALNDAVRAGKITRNPASVVTFGKQRRAKPLLWTAERVERWQETGKTPAKVMVWTQHQCGAFLDATENELLHPLFQLAAYWGLRRGELVGLEWADVSLDSGRVHIRQAQPDDELDDTKTENSDRVIRIDEETLATLKAWRKRQAAKRLEWGEAWVDSGRVFTRENGEPLRPEWVSERFGTLAARAGLPPVRFHDLRHGAATMLLAAGVPMKVISETLGHATAAFTSDVYASVAEELQEQAAVAIAAFVPRRKRLTVVRAINVPTEGSSDL
ncbi:tyrosine-type recombinase/integrase [Nonomuraea angiospora]|uniref:tyrosine-type recombinase/integrase n=1 Tax=Nonomuraea angiospora TaxID=46172 RepID=UPI0029A5F81B|nr:site-specific integrase [Nonomuraea angiospora]MDX3099706.1 site-specific integrase [Nonomuraea angiospora]